MIVDGMANAFIQQWAVDADVPGSRLNRVSPLPSDVARHIRMGVVILAHLNGGAAGHGQDGKQQKNQSKSLTRSSMVPGETILRG